MAKIDFNNVQTMIGAEAVVNGPIKLRGGIIVYGKVYGDIHTDGPVRITLSGEIIGDVQARMRTLAVGYKAILPFLIE
ncbi:MAG: hypothetical protein Ct9H300mP29_5350 [Candidatus Neomarinimicrobiota bacterium]|nr:MAG: hypothetical protein Ct9H300mP29_5350 [Candidatus Neomarinimicrobiota bacterium]